MNYSSINQENVILTKPYVNYMNANTPQMFQSTAIGGAKKHKISRKKKINGKNKKTNKRKRIIHKK